MLIAGEINADGEIEAEGAATQMPPMVKIPFDSDTS
jgi:hypothetical protein